MWGLSINPFLTLPFMLAKNFLGAKNLPQKMKSFCAIKKVANVKGGVGKIDIQSF